MTTLIRVPKDTTSPSLSDTIMVDNVPQNITGATVKFRMRPANSGTLKVDANGVVVTPTAGTVRYDWASADTDTGAKYYGWWKVTLSSGKILETPEFIIIVDEHTPGDGITTGAVYQRAREHMPISWDSLSKDQRYGDQLLQSRVDLVKYKLFATASTAAAEATLYDLFVLDFMGKVSALQVIPAAIEYWMDQQVSISTTGTQESVNYPDRIRALKDLQEWLVAQIANDRADVEAILPFKIRRRAKFPAVSDTGTLRTSDPNRFPREYGDPIPTDVWGSWNSGWPF